MPIANRILQLDTSTITISPSRQRSILEPGPLLELACSIGRSQWVSPILVDESNNTLVAGERRLTAVQRLAAAVNGDFSSWPNPDEARLDLFPVCTCKVESWHNWTRIPVQYGRDLTDLDLIAFEFIENAHRADLSWQDKARAIYLLHAASLRTDPTWNHAKTGALVGLSYSHVAACVRAWDAFENAESNDVKTIITDSPTLKAAAASLDRYKSRRAEHVVDLTSRSITPSRPGPAPGTKPVAAQTSVLEDEAEPSSPSTLGESILLNTCFHEWAAGYSGPPFNFIHCDFPYGVNFNKGEQARSVATSLAGEYDDSPEVYWSLLKTLATYQESIIAPSAHILFWFSQNLRAETEAFFKEHFPFATLQSHLLVWHCSDLDGIVPDPQRYGRRTYETAMVLSFGDRRVVSPKALSFSAPRGSATRVHRSQKPLTVLDHFFSMFVDDSSSVLDPTAGSGTSLLAARSLRANRVLGLELDPKIYENSIAFINQRKEAVGL
jgi:hypothetical protein